MCFNTICTFLSVIREQFQDAGLSIESGIIAEGSITGVLDGAKYNRSIRFHKLRFEALNRLAWMEFMPWTEHHQEKKPLVDEFFTGLKALCDETSEKRIQSNHDKPLV